MSIDTADTIPAPNLVSDDVVRELDKLALSKNGEANLAFHEGRMVDFYKFAGWMSGVRAAADHVRAMEVK